MWQLPGVGESVCDDSYDVQTLFRQLAQIGLQSARISDNPFGIIDQTDQRLAIWMRLVSSNVDKKFVRYLGLVTPGPSDLNFDNDVFSF